MTRFGHLFAAFLMMFVLVDSAEAAKKFGGGGFGKSYSSPTAPKSSPTPTDSVQPRSTPAGRSDRGRGGMMGGMLGGLMAGGLFAYLLGSGAFEGIQLLDMLLLAVLAFVLFRLMRGPKARYQTEPSFRQDADENDAGISSIMARSEPTRAPMNLPEQFDQGAFVSAALEHYRTVQQAWNDGDLDTVREYLAPELHEQLTNQRLSMNDNPPRTEVLDLVADIIRADQAGEVRQMSLLFRGRSRDMSTGEEAGIFDTWHLERDMSQPDSPWLVVGVEAE